jgi:uncharacterized phiE125 gp8 family phage protein
MKPMRVSFHLKTAATLEPVGLTEALAHLRITGTGPEAEVTHYVSAARAFIEAYTGRSLANETRIMRASCWLDTFDLDRSPIASITSVKYYPEDESGQVAVDPSLYWLGHSEPSVVGFKDAFTFPALDGRPDAVEIEYVCSPGVVPPDLLNAVKLVAADKEAFRLETITGTTQSAHPRLMQVLTAHRIGGFIA